MLDFFRAGWLCGIRKSHVAVPHDTIENINRMLMFQPGTHHYEAAKIGLDRNVREYLRMPSNPSPERTK